MGNVNSVPHQRLEEEEGLLKQELGQEQRRIEKLVVNINKKLIVVFSEFLITHYFHRLTLEKHDQLLLFKISNVERLKERFCTKLPIVDIIDQMGSFVPQKYKVITFSNLCLIIIVCAFTIETFNHRFITMLWQNYTEKHYED